MCYISSIYETVCLIVCWLFTSCNTLCSLFLHLTISFLLKVFHIVLPGILTYKHISNIYISLLLVKKNFIRAYLEFICLGLLGIYIFRCIWNLYF